MKGPPARPVTLVTGASSGIGREIARLAARDSRAVVLVARSRGRLEELAGELERAHPGLEAVPWTCDLADARERRALFSGLETRGLAVDHLVNAAGVGVTGRFDTIDALGMIEVNVTAVVQLLHELLPAMVERGYGRVLNVASTAGFQPVPYFATYAATKAFVQNLSEALWREHAGTGVTVTCLCPGKTDTEFFAGKGFHRTLFASVPREEPEEVARAGYEGMLAGRRLVVPGFRNKLNRWLVALSPRRLLLEAGAVFFRPSD